MFGRQALFKHGHRGGSQGRRKGWGAGRESGGGKVEGERSRGCGLDCKCQLHIYP